jgi:hypothetical protein
MFIQMKKRQQSMKQLQLNLKTKKKLDKVGITIAPMEVINTK